MGVAAALVAGDVEDAGQFAVGGENGGGGAGQDGVALQEMLGAVDLDGAAVGQGGADGVGAPVLLVPGGAPGEGDALGLARKSGSPRVCMSRPWRSARMTMLWLCRTCS